jgi:hypothetical protein
MEGVAGGPNGASKSVGGLGGTSKSVGRTAGGPGGLGTSSSLISEVVGVIKSVEPLEKAESIEGSSVVTSAEPESSSARASSTTNMLAMKASSIDSMTSVASSPIV